MTTSHARTRPFPPSLALWLALIGAVSMLYYHEALLMPRAAAAWSARDLGKGYQFGNDFYQVWLTSRQWLRQGRDPYSQEMTRQIQVGLYGRALDPSRPSDPRDPRAFPYPVFADLLFWPAAEFPFESVRIALVVLLAGLVIATVLLWLRGLGWRLGRQSSAIVVLLTFCSYPVLEGLFAVQLGLIVAFLLAGALVALQRQRFLFAGFLMALATMKPHVVMLVIFYLLLWSISNWRVRGRFWVGFFSTLILLLGASLAALPGWIHSWMHEVVAYHEYTPPPLVAEVLALPLGSRLAGPANFVLTAGSIVAALLLAWRNRGAAFGSFVFWTTLGLMLCITTITMLPGQAVYDHLILLPPILLLARYRSGLYDAGRVPRILLWIGGLVLFWPDFAAFALILMRPWVASRIFDSAVIFALPIRSAASLPFVVLALLAWGLRVSPLKNSEGVAVTAGV